MQQRELTRDAKYVASTRSHVADWLPIPYPRPNQSALVVSSRPLFFSTHTHTNTHYARASFLFDTEWCRELTGKAVWGNAEETRERAQVQWEMDDEEVNSWAVSKLNHDSKR